MKILVLSDFLPDHKLIFSENFEKILYDADAIVFNLEGSPLLSENARNKPLQIMPFDVRKIIAFIKKYGGDKFYVALANNHILDNGVSGFDYLIKELKQNEIQYFGTVDQPYADIGGVAILNLVTSETVAKKKISESRLNYLFYNTNKINGQISELESKYQKLIFYPHWGRDMDTKIFKTFDKKLKFKKDWMIFGHHPHVISGITKNKIYSMGNNYIPHPYYFDTYPATHFGLAIYLNSNSMSYELYTTQLNKVNNKYHLDFKIFNGVDDAVIQHGKEHSFVKMTFLKFFSFQGNFLDLIKLRTLQVLSSLFALKYKLSQKKNK